MKMNKILAVALSCATMAMSVSAFADTATYDAEKVSVAVAIEDGTLVPAADEQLTVVVVPASFGADTAATAENIYYINQAEAGDEFTAIINEMGLKGELVEGETYEVRIGGESLSDVIKIEFTVAEESTGTFIDLMQGDVDNDREITTNDAACILSSMIGGSKMPGDAVVAIESEASISYEGASYTIMWGDVDNDREITTNDAACILSSMIGGSKTPGSAVAPIESTVSVSIAE